MYMYHKTREFILDGTIILTYVKSENYPADVLTKATSASIFKFPVPAVYGNFKYM